MHMHILSRGPRNLRVNARCGILDLACLGLLLPVGGRGYAQLGRRLGTKQYEEGGSTMRQEGRASLRWGHGHRSFWRAWS